MIRSEEEGDLRHLKEGDEAAIASSAHTGGQSDPVTQDLPDGSSDRVQVVPRHLVYSTVQSDAQPSSSDVLPSSHCSLPSTCPSPHTGTGVVSGSVHTPAV